MKNPAGLFREHGLSVKERVRLSPYTTLRVGGEARVWLAPKNYYEVLLGMELAEKAELPVFFLGGGSNLLVRDGGFPGVVISLKNLTNLHYLGEGLVEAGAGVRLSALLRLSLEKGLSGLEFLAGVPATVGGLVAMNAGAFGSEIKNILKEVVILHRGMIRVLCASDLNFSYRSWGGPEGAVILKAVLRLKPSSTEEVRERIRMFLEKRRKSQPLGEATAGCVFKNPEGISAGFLIEQVGLKGFSRGRAAFSEKHANFIVTREGARAEEVLYLMDKAKEEVLRAFGLTLSEEVVIVGEA